MSPARDWPIPIRWCGSRPLTCSTTFRATGSGPLSRHFSPIQAAASASGQYRCWPTSRPQTSLPTTARLSSAPPPSSSLRSVLTLIGPKPARHLEISMRVAGSLPMPRTNIRLHFGSALNMRPAAINLADLYRQLGRDGDAERARFGQPLHPHARTRDCTMLSGSTLTRQKQLDGALTEFRTAAELEPDRSATAMSTPLHCIRPAASRNR